MSPNQVDSKRLRELDEKLDFMGDYFLPSMHSDEDGDTELKVDRNTLAR